MNEKIDHKDYTWRGHSLKHFLYCTLCSWLAVNDDYYLTSSATGYSIVDVASAVGLHFAVTYLQVGHKSQSDNFLQ